MRPAAPSDATRPTRWLAASGAACAALAVALAAYAAHAAAAGHDTLQIAAALLFGHGVALAALARGVLARRRRWALTGLLVGSLMFAGSVALHALAQVPPRLAPPGGVLLIGSWLLLAFDLLGD